MPQKNPEARRDYMRKYAQKRLAADPEEARAKNRERMRLHRSRTSEERAVARAARKLSPEESQKRIRAAKQQQYLENKDKIKARSKDWYHANKSKVRSTHQAWVRNNPEENKAIKLRHHYNISLEQWNEMFRDQGGCCRICHTTDPGTKGWNTDHDHSCCPGSKSCGKCVRGILCSGCNSGLGHFKDNISTLLRAADYLRQWSGEVCHA
jgi:Recombination endonuclease VII